MKILVLAVSLWLLGVQQKPPNNIVIGLHISLAKPDTEVDAIEIDNPIGTLVVKIHGDGSVEYGKGFTSQTAAKEFWIELGKEYSIVCSQGQTGGPSK